MKRRFCLLLLFAESLIFIFNIFFIVIGFFMLHDEKKTYEKEGKIYISIQHESSPFAVNDLQIFEDTWNKLSGIEKSQYYEIYIQPLEQTQSVGLPTEEGSISAIQISKNVQDDFFFDLLSGRKFSDRDFLISEKQIPVILGYDFSDTLRVGDHFRAEYLFDEYEFVVIGLLKEHTWVNMINQIYLLDGRVVMPSFWIADDTPITDGLKIHYANKTSGKICTDEQNKFEVLKSIEDITASSQAGVYSLSSTSNDLNIKTFTGMRIKSILLLNVFMICLVSPTLIITLKKMSRLSPAAATAAQS